MNHSAFFFPLKHNFLLFMFPYIYPVPKKIIIKKQKLSPEERKKPKDLGDEESIPCLNEEIKHKLILDAEKLYKCCVVCWALHVEAVNCIIPQKSTKLVFINDNPSVSFSSTEPEKNIYCRCQV